MADEPKGHYVAGEPFTREELLAVCPWLAEFLPDPGGPTKPAVITVRSTMIRKAPSD
jgi:hypothetical protein